MAFVYGTFKLRINGIHNEGTNTNRYHATVLDVIEQPETGPRVRKGDRVTVKFRHINERQTPDGSEFFNQTAVFDGINNDIQNEPTEKILSGRGGSNHKNPFINEIFPTDDHHIETKRKSNMDTCVDLLKENHNLILTGAPGTGKTYLAKEIAKKIIFQDKPEEQKTQKLFDECCDFVQFHPSYDYTDFVEGLRPKKTDSSTEIGFELKNGIFKQFCKNALVRQPQKCVFIIDEINRGEISKIFGELFFSIEPSYRGEKGKVKTQYANMQIGDTIFDPAGWFYIPENVYIIGTMNDIDRSVESFDFAMRRRFIWQEITAEESAENMNLPLMAKTRMKRLNDAIVKIEGLSSSYQIGAAYFRKVDDRNIVIEPDYNELWKLRLEPLLREYLRGMQDMDTKMKQLKDAYDGAIRASTDENN